MRLGNDQKLPRERAIAARQGRKRLAQIEADQDRTRAGALPNTRPLDHLGDGAPLDRARRELAFRTARAV